MLLLIAHPFQPCTVEPPALMHVPLPGLHLLCCPLLPHHMLLLSCVCLPHAARVCVPTGCPRLRGNNSATTAAAIPSHPLPQFEVFTRQSAHASKYFMAFTDAQKDVDVSAQMW